MGTQDTKNPQLLFKLLKSHYPDAKIILKWGNNFELLVAIILSAQCTDKKVNEVTAELFPKYRKKIYNFYKYYNRYKNYNSPEEEIVEIVNFAEIPIQELEQDIKSTGFYHAKAKSVQGAAKTILEKYQGIIPKAILELTTIPGVGRKTANVFLGNAYNIVEGIAVDTHVRKQSRNLGLTKNTDPDKIEQDLMKLFPKKQWFQLTYLLIEHGRNMRKRQSERLICGKSNCAICNQR